MIRVERTLISDAESKGKAEGKAEGEYLAKIETAKKLKQQGILSLDQISEATGSDISVIKNLQK